MPMLSHNPWFFAEKMSLRTGKHTFLVLSSKKTKKVHSSYQVSRLDQKGGMEREGGAKWFATWWAMRAALLSLGRLGTGRMTMPPEMRDERGHREERPTAIAQRSAFRVRAYGAGILGVSAVTSLVWAASIMAAMTFCQSPTIPYRA